MIEMVEVAELKVIGDHSLWLRFSDGQEGVRDCSDILAVVVRWLNLSAIPRCLFARFCLLSFTPARWPTPLHETVGDLANRLLGSRRRQRGRFFYGAAEPVFELDPGRLDHPHWSQGAATPPEHVV